MDSPAESVRSRTRGARTPELSEPLYQVKLLASLRSGDTAAVQSFLSSLSTRSGTPKTPVNNDTGSSVDVAAAALHLAIRCAPIEVVEQMLGHRAINPNAFHPPGSKTTPLHLASSIGRSEVVELLLEQKEVDDALRDEQGRTCKEVARNKDVAQIIQDSRSLLQASYRSLLRTYILSPHNAPPPSALLDLLSSPRTKSLDLSCLDDSTGTTLLHEAARRKDLRLVELSVRAGADVFVRDKKGKTVGEGAGKDDRVKVFLRQFTNQDTTLLDGPTTSPPVLKGFLSKYTNVAKGYNSRWFVLSDGTLSYYRHREDEGQASRGSIAMASASLKSPSAGDKLRFEVLSHPSGSKNITAQRWWIKANHPGEASRWAHAIQRSIEWSRQERVKQKETAESISQATSLKTRHSKRGSVSGMSATSSRGEGAGMITDDADEKIEESSQTSLSESAEGSNPPHNDTYELQANSLAAQIEMTERLLESLALPPMPSPDVLETRKGLQDSLATLQTMLSQYTSMSRDREDWWKDKLAKERDRAVVWEESLNVVVREGEVLERELRNTLRAKKPLKRPTTSSWDDASRLARSFSDSSQPPIAPTIVATAPTPQKEETELNASIISSSATATTDSLRTAADSMTISIPSIPSLTVTEIVQESADTDEEDEFFDAIESNTLPNLEISTPLVSAPVQPASFLDSEQYVPYQHMRSKMPIGADGRPPMSLWSVLKNNIGKDLTRISFPVTFNEPTSMLQRMAEDMEFSECLDAAVADEDPLRRIAYVAAFAMSNYSSTIGRIAKPFNPMLGETFEYARIDKRYRYVSEQVSHHPPISACWAESHSWHYYGEVDAQNKFMGKSFEIRPTGVAHAELLLPQLDYPDYPKANGPENAGKVVEHYSWKKVTTNVSGFILGSPTIDHYGEMTIVNHRTQDKCVLSFKPRGWRGKDAFEITGKVIDSHGKVAYEIAGRWNSQLVARAVGTGIGELLPDVEIEDGARSPRSISEPRYVLLWRNTVKPQSPFNLTPFAVTLNDMPDDLGAHLCPTDCRLRPDQRAFEKGDYDTANLLKMKQEEFQRSTRKKREEGLMPPHQPRWFKSSTDDDTRERVWVPLRVARDEPVDYWATREQVWLANKDGEKVEWPDVDHIFI